MNRKLRSITKRVLASNLRLYKNRPKNHNMTLLFYNEIGLVFPFIPNANQSSTVAIFTLSIIFFIIFFLVDVKKILLDLIEKDNRCLRKPSTTQTVCLANRKICNAMLLILEIDVWNFQIDQLGHFGGLNLTITNRRIDFCYKNIRQKIN